MFKFASEAKSCFSSCTMHWRVMMTTLSRAGIPISREREFRAILMSNQTVLGSLANSVEELEGTKRLFVIQPGL
jgi:hypothetical protein